MWQFFKAQACAEQQSHKRLRLMSDHVNTQNQSLHQLGKQNQELQLLLNNANQRVQELKAACTVSEKGRTSAKSQLQKTQQDLYHSKDALNHEFQCSQRTEVAFNLQAEALKRLSEFFNSLQIASSENKEAAVTLMSGNGIASLLEESDYKDRIIAALEEKCEKQKANFEELLDKQQTEYLITLRQRRDELELEGSPVPPLERQRSRRGRSRKDRARTEGHSWIGSRPEFEGTVDG